MEEAGGKVLYPLVDLAVMWFVRVLLNLHKFFELLDEAERVVPSRTGPTRWS